MTIFRRSSLVLAATLTCNCVDGLQVTAPQHVSPQKVAAHSSSRRDVLTNAALIFASAWTTNQQEAHASARGYHISRKLKAKEAELRENAPPQALPSGVMVQQFQNGRSGFGTSEKYILGPNRQVISNLS